MKDGVGLFRKPLVGGFHKHDVIKYITKLAKQRNEAVAAIKEAEEKQQPLLDAIAELHKRNVDITREMSVNKMLKASTLETAAETFSRLEKAVARLHKDIDAACGHTPPDLIRAAHAIAKIMPLIEQSRSLIDEIQDSIKE